MPSAPGEPPENETADLPVLYETRGKVAIISLNRPRYANAQNDAMTYALDAAFMRAMNDDDVVAIILRAEGKHFCAGHDYSSPDKAWRRAPDPKTMWYGFEDKSSVEARYAREQEVYLGMCRRWRDMPKITVAAVQGACIAGGLMLAWVCDLVIASDDAYFSDPVVAMGVPGVEYFAHAFELPPRIAREFLLLGEKMDASRAREHGMVNRVVPRDQLLAEALAVAAKLAERPRFALALTKQALNFVDDLRGKRTAMEGVFAMHHVAHAHAEHLSGSPIMGQTVPRMKAQIEGAPAPGARRED